MEPKTIDQLKKDRKELESTIQKIVNSFVEVYGEYVTITDISLTNMIGENGRQIAVITKVNTKLNP